MTYPLPPRFLLSTVLWAELLGGFRSDLSVLFFCFQHGVTVCEAFSDEVLKGMPKHTAQEIVESSKHQGVKIFVRENEKDGVVGFLTMIEGSSVRPAQIHLADVASAFCGKGIGRQLVQEALKRAKAVDRKKVILFTRPWSVAMRKICAELGYVPEGYLRQDFLNEDVILYSAFL
jgi:RimJ/RimL family protein N-acetyltransferase